MSYNPLSNLMVSRVYHDFRRRYGEEVAERYLKVVSKIPDQRTDEEKQAWFRERSEERKRTKTYNNRKRKFTSHVLTF